MPVDAEETVSTDVLYPDSLEGDTLEIDPEGRLDGGLAFWHAEGDAEALPDGAKNGLYLPVDSAEHGEVWAAMPRDLRQALIDAGVESGDIVEIVTCKKGPGETDPYEVDLALITDG